jgi:hypothetical protein
MLVQIFSKARAKASASCRRDRIRKEEEKKEMSEERKKRQQ